MVTPAGNINGSRNLGDWEYGKFRPDSNDRPAVAVINGDGAVLATSDNQTNGSQKTQIVDGVGSNIDIATADNQTNGNQITQIAALPSIYNGSKTAPTGTAEAIATTQAIHSVTVKALSTNTVSVYIGATGVTTSTGIELLPGESVSLDVTDLSSVFVISGTASQVVRYISL